MDVPSRTLEFFAGRDNYEDIVLLQGSPATPVDVTGLTRVMLRLGGGPDIDAQGSGNVIEWPVDVTLADGSAAKAIRLHLGAEAEALPGHYGRSRLVIFDATYPDGFTWFENLLVIVH